MACCGQDQTLAEDVLQTTYLKVLEGRARFSGRAAFRTWLFTVIRNTACDATRRQRLRRLLFVNRRGAVESFSGADAGVEIDRSRQRVRFRELLARLPQRQREVIHLVFYHDLTLRESAEVMGVSLGSARTHYARGKQRLRRWLEDQDHEYRRPKHKGVLS